MIFIINGIRYLLRETTAPFAKIRVIPPFAAGFVKQREVRWTGMRRAQAGNGIRSPIRPAVRGYRPAAGRYVLTVNRRPQTARLFVGPSQAAGRETVHRPNGYYTFETLTLPPEGCACVKDGERLAPKLLPSFFLCLNFVTACVYRRKPPDACVLLRFML